MSGGSTCRWRQRNWAFAADANGDYAYVLNTAGVQHLADGASVTDSFSYQATDGLAQSNLATLTVTITGVNDAPAGTDNTVSTRTNNSYVFAASDFGFADPIDTPANNFAGVFVSNINLPSGSTLQDNGVDVGEGDFVRNNTPQRRS